MNVYSSSEKTSNILARNKDFHNIALEVDNSNAQIIFNHSDISTNIVFEPLNDQLRFPEQVVFATERKAGTAPLIVEENGRNTKPFADFIYDMSSSFPIQIRSNDVSTNAMAFFSDASQKGWYVGGAHFPPDPSRQMGFMGWEDASGHFMPSQVHVSGNYLKKNKVVTGINTFQPKVESYVLDINGPVKVQHQELRESAKTGFSLNSVSFSKINPSFGLAVGKEKRIDQDNQSYNRFLKTKNFGVTWETIDVSFTKYTDQNAETDLGVYSFDMSNAVAVSKSEFNLHILRTQDQGETWDISYIDLS